jgi:hypothetical protein
MEFSHGMGDKVPAFSTPLLISQQRRTMAYTVFLHEGDYLQTSMSISFRGRVLRTTRVEM